MGCGVAQSLATTGHRVVLADVSEAVLEQSRATVRSQLRGMALFTGVRVDIDETMERISLVTDLEEMAAADFVVENVTEDWDVKKALYPSSTGSAGPTWSSPSTPPPSRSLASAR